MTHIRYWAATMAAALCGGFIAIDRFAFSPGSVIWITFAVAIAATVFSLAGLLVALFRDDAAFSGLSALGVLVSGWTIIAMRTLSQPTAVWLAFAGGVALLLVSVRALALHESTVERVVHALSPNGSQATASSTTATRSRSRLGVQRLSVSATMRSQMHWLAHTGMMVIGAFIVLMTFALTSPGTHHPSPRWLAFALGIAAVSIALGALLGLALARNAGESDDGRASGWLLGSVATVGSGLVGAALIVTMIVYTGSTARWVAFALGCGMVGVSLFASVIHELTSERVRHELEIAHPATEPAFQHSGTTASTTA